MSGRKRHRRPLAGHLHRERHRRGQRERAAPGAVELRRRRARRRRGDDQRERCEPERGANRGSRGSLLERRYDTVGPAELQLVLLDRQLEQEPVVCVVAVAACWSARSRGTPRVARRARRDAAARARAGCPDRRARRRRAGGRRRRASRDPGRSASAAAPPARRSSRRRAPCPAAGPGARRAATRSRRARASGARCRAASSRASRRARCSCASA